MVLGWLAVAFLVSLAGWFRNVSAPVVAITVWSLTVVALLLLWKIPALRHWVSITPLRWFVLFHVTRFVGFYFIVLYQRHRLPYAFAVPAGVGDVLVAITALLLSLSPQFDHQPRRALLLLWNGFGFVDIVFVVFNALRLGLRDWQSMAAFRELPLSLLPTFLVPLVIVSHIVIFIRLIKAPAER